jgi:acyl carrier protein
MSGADPRDEVRRFLAREFPDRAAEVEGLSDGDPLFERGLVDSLSFLGLVQHLEERFGITVPPGDFAPERFRSLAEIAAYVEQARSGGR